MFSVVCVCQFVYPKVGPHMAITHDVLDLTFQGSPPDMRAHFTGQRSPSGHGTSATSDIWLPSLETCSDLFTTGSFPSLVLTSGGY